MSLYTPAGKRILIITGHYGSGKTEFVVSLASLLAQNNCTGFQRIAICDLDVVNPYFRSREMTAELEKLGVKVYGGLYGTGTTAEIPELSPAVRAPLEDKECFTIVDAGGNDSGARILNQFGKYFDDGDTYIAAVVNASRPETSDFDGAAEQLAQIEEATGRTIDGIISNTHLLTYTTDNHIKEGYLLAKNLAEALNKELWCVTYPEMLVSPEQISEINSLKIPVGMHMRQTWLDK